MLFGKKYNYLVEIDGMHCPHCAQRVIDSLMTIDGVKKVSINLEKKQASIIAKNELTTEVIKNKIDSIGFKFVKVI